MRVRRSGGASPTFLGFRVSRSSATIATGDALYLNACVPTKAIKLVKKWQRRCQTFHQRRNFEWIYGGVDI